MPLTGQPRHNLIRTNEVHQEQEAKLILEDGFSYEQIDKEESHQTTRIEVEESCLHKINSKDLDMRYHQHL